MPNTFGHMFRITTFGESHGGGVGVIIDGVKPKTKVDIDLIQEALDRRRPGQSEFVTPRGELDQVECFSGLENGVALGTPIMLLVKNKDAKPTHYSDIQKVFRPSHADYTTKMRYGVAASSGGGRASARETIGRVAAGAVAEQMLKQNIPECEVLSFVESIKDIRIEMDAAAILGLKRQDIESNPLRFPDAANLERAKKLIKDVQGKGDTVGGSVRCVIQNAPIGLGDPVFDKLEADLAKAMMSLPASKGFEVGSGFGGTQLFGSQHNDAFVNEGGRIRTTTNRSGGIQGGISNGEPIDFRVAFKPVSTIFKEQKTVTESGEEVAFKPKAGRHDPCVLPRAVPMVDAMAWLVVADHWLRLHAVR